MQRIETSLRAIAEANGRIERRLSWNRANDSNLAPEDNDDIAASATEIITNAWRILASLYPLKARKDSKQ